jgi:2-alkyl-3-oxoalkanoate reductase
MKVFLAGATGAIGKRLLPQLVAAGHIVTGTTRLPGKADAIRRLGARAEIIDALDEKEVIDAVRRSQPEVIIHELTDIPDRFDIRRFDEAFALTNRLRTKATDYLIDAAQRVGCRRFIAQSYTGWPYARTGSWIKNEDDLLLSTPDPENRETFQAILHLESEVLFSPGIEGFVLRYGSFYGPGTSLGRGGSMLDEIRKRHIPVIGKGSGHWSFVHIEDAATATLAAVDALTPGVYNICDDEPAPVAEWLPYLAKTIGAKKPRYLPKWIGRIVAGKHGAAMMTEIRGASNQKAKSLLPWTLRWPSWRKGFRDGLGEPIREINKARRLSKAG